MDVGELIWTDFLSKAKYTPNHTGNQSQPPHFWWLSITSWPPLLHSHPDMYTMFQVCDHLPYLQPCPAEDHHHRMYWCWCLSHLSIAKGFSGCYDTLSPPVELNLWGVFWFHILIQCLHSPNFFIPSFRLARTRQTLPLHSVPTIVFLESNVSRESAPFLMVFAKKINPMNWESIHN